ncbi:hypothetical protein [Fundidesulfovibrio terrae]|uniref:hypothetical protein n=1 Tax=Fundidesulfovibrio terrae TaxID=2922866 RepID=UPI001FAF7A98|nr:hypothetical protein [Fundidesulfovibrio terrae]
MRSVAACILLALFAAPCLAQDRPWLPDDLKPWEGWVLYGLEQSQCPPLATDPAQRRCLFPTRLALSVDSDGASFSMTWRVFAESTVPLPAAPGLWPAQVKADGRGVAVVDQSGVPGVRLTPGEHVLTGVLPWKRRPQSLAVSPLTGVVELKIDGVPVALPKLDAGGSLDISGREERAAPEDSVQTKVFRLVRDGVPLTVTTLARLDVSGRARTVVLDGLLPPGTEPMSVSAPVPVGFGPGGRVLVQAGAGRYDIEISGRYREQAQALGPVRTPFGREVWAFAADPGLRDVQPKGMASVDPQTTDLPDAWKKFPAFLAEEGTTLSLDVIRRGEARPKGDELGVKRILWLDFDGKGITARDILTGTVRRGWSLAMTPPGELGRATLAGKDLPVVLLDKELRGIEIRDSAVNLTAESRYPDAQADLPASGWRAGASSLAVDVRLPPGWRLAHVEGPASASQTWVSRWDLLNIFLTLLMVAGAWKLRGVAAALVLLAYLVLAQHEPGAPIELWLVLLAGLGVMKALERPGAPDSWRKALRLASLFSAAAAVSLILAALPFLIGQIRSGVYPQLEDLHSGLFQDMSTPAQEPAQPQAVPSPAATTLAREKARKDAPQLLSKGVASSLEQDPKSLVQTGPGIPAWAWRSVSLRWNGPVEPSQTLRMILVGPPLFSILCFIRVVLFLGALVLLARKSWHPPGKAATGAAAAVALVLAFAGPSLAGPATGAVPPKEVLDELRARLTAPAECFPACAGVSSLAVSLDAKSLRLTLATGAAARLVLPLPVVSDGWRPQSVSVDGKPAPVLASEGGLGVLLEPGAHAVVVTGAAPPGVSFSIGAAFAPRSVSVDAPGFSVLGVGPDGTFEGGLRFSRREDPGQGGKPLVTAVIPTFLAVDRVLELGLEWSAVTTVRRLSRSGEPVVVQVPLLPGESVLDQDVRVEDGKAVVSLAAGQSQTSWRSRLEIAPELELTAPWGTAWVETWRLTASPVWDCSLSGIPVSASLDEAGRWSPLWRPWPGEKAVIAVSRPAPAPGESLTIDSATLRLIPGERVDAAALDVRLRSALGGRHVFKVPLTAEITGVAVGGKPAPWSGGNPGEIGLALPPGRQDIHLGWKQPRPSLGEVETPEVDLGHPAVNASVSVEMPRDRWILRVHGDTPMAPAVLIWGAVMAVAVAAVGLGFLPGTPLRRRQWFLLGLGLTQVDMGASLGAVLWLIALGLRRRHSASGRVAFNAVQVCLVILTLAGLSCLFEAIRTGLLGMPSMKIAGNGSTDSMLRWYFDRVGAVLPSTQVWSVSLWWYRGVMLAWSLWMALSLIKWLRWGWDSFTDGGAWRKAERKPGKRGEEAPEKPVLRAGLEPAPQADESRQSPEQAEDQAAPEASPKGVSPEEAPPKADRKA